MDKDKALDLALEELENCADLLKVFDAQLDSCVGASMLQAEKAITAIKQAQALDKKAENARELGLDYEPVGEAYLCDKCQTPFDGAWECPNCGHRSATKEPVYTTPPAAQPAPVKDEHQAFIDALPKDGEDKMFMQISHWARESYKRYQSSVRGQMITAADAYESHVIWATLRWAKENTPPAQPAPVQEPAFWHYTLVVEGQVVNEAFTTVNLDTRVEPFGRYDIDHGGDVTKEPLYTTPPYVATPLAAQRERQGLTDEEIEDVWASCEPDWDDKVNVLTLARAIEQRLKEKNHHG
jgi:uncharacterized Zn finger protein (UPF0148 family)